MSSFENHPLSKLELTRPEKQVLLALRSLLPGSQKEPRSLYPYCYSISGKGFDDSWYQSVFAGLYERCIAHTYCPLTRRPTGNPIVRKEGDRIDLCPVSLYILHSLGKLRY